mgnify:CR=1 FL=1
MKLECTPNQALKVVGVVRKNLALMGKSPVVSSDDYFEAFQQAQNMASEMQKSPLQKSKKRNGRHNLDIKIIPYPKKMVEYGLLPDTPLDDRKQVLNIQANSEYEMQPEEVSLQQVFDQNLMSSRQASFAVRTLLETLWFRDRGYHPFFVTFTLDPSKVYDWAEAKNLRSDDTDEAYGEVLKLYWQDPANFRRIRYEFASIAREALGLSKKQAEKLDLYRYCAVIEHGRTANHHHLHVLLAFKDVPADMKRDPNIGSLEYTNECRALKGRLSKAHPMGTLDARFVRYIGDPWSKYGFRQETKIVDGVRQLVPLKGPQAIAIYMAKYLSKDDREFRHRVKCPQGFGKRLILDHIENWHPNMLLRLTVRPLSADLNIRLSQIHCIPLPFLREIANKELFRRIFEYGGDASHYLREMPSFYVDLVNSLKKRKVDPRRLSSSKFYELASAHLDQPHSYTEKELAYAHGKLADAFPSQFSIDLGQFECSE